MEKLCSGRLFSKRYAPEACGLQRSPFVRGKLQEHNLSISREGRESKGRAKRADIHVDSF